MAEAWKSMYTDLTVRQLENLPPDGEITAELQAKYSTLFTRKVEDVRLAGLNLAAGDLVRDQETERIANLATPAYWAQCGVHPVDLEDCAPGKHALQRLLYQAVLDFKVKHPKLGVIDTPTVSAYVRAVLEELGRLGYEIESLGASYFVWSTLDELTKRRLTAVHWTARAKAREPGGTCSTLLKWVHTWYEVQSPQHIARAQLYSGKFPQFRHEPWPISSAGLRYVDRTPSDWTAPPGPSTTGAWWRT